MEAGSGSTTGFGHGGGPLGRFLRRRRTERGFARPGELARVMRPGSSLDAISRLGGRVRNLEEEGMGDRTLLEAIVTALGIDPDELGRVIAEERRFRRERQEEIRIKWDAWASEPVRPYLVRKIIPAVYVHRDAPGDVVSRDEAEVWAAEVARKERQQVCLVFNRRLRTWFDGGKSWRSEATPDSPGHPYTEIGGKKVLFSTAETPPVGRFSYR